MERVQEAVISDNMSMVNIVPIIIARHSNNSAVREELLLRTEVNQEKGSVNWNNLCLRNLELSWIKKIHWVRRLRLAHNGFKTIPNEIGGYLRQVCIIFHIVICEQIFITDNQTSPSTQ